MKFTRRMLLAGAVAPLHARTGRFRYAVCNETFEGSNFAEGCRLAKGIGYTGLEIAPSTLATDPTSLSASQRREYRNAIASEGLGYVGLHSLLSAPAGLQIATTDATVRERSWDFFRRLVDLAADLGPKPVLVLGSGKQRTAAGGTAGDGRKRLRDGLAVLASHAAERDASILLEPLSPQFTNVVNTLGEAVGIVREIGSPAVQSMFDTHNTVAETEPHDELIRRYAQYIRHIHVNELDGRHPGTGQFDFARVMRALADIQYPGWISLEVFQFQPSGAEVAKQAWTFLRRTEDSLREGRR